jgi:DNA-binding CsgD family transcriptional regulator
VQTPSGNDAVRLAGSPIRGRATELETIDAQIAALVQGRGNVLIIEGSPGIGKTRLLRELAVRAREMGIRTLFGEAFESQQAVPYSPLFAATLLADPPVGDAREFRELGSSAGQGFWVLKPLQEAIESAARQTPLAILLEDLHWADNATLFALSSLTASPTAAPVWWVFTARSGAGNPIVQKTLFELARNGAVRLRLNAMSISEITDVVEDVVRARADETLLDLVTKTHGNPFLLMELIGGLSEEGRLAVAQGRAVARGDALPNRLSAGMQQRLDRLSPHGREVVQVAAALPDRFSATLLAKTLERNPTALISAIDEAVRADLFDDEGDHLRFRHDLLREATRQTLPRSLLRAMERQSATVMLDLGTPPVEVATQLARSATVGDLAAIAALSDAAQSIASGDPSAAADLSRRAVDLLGANDSQRGSLVTETVLLLNRAARYDEAQELAAVTLASAVSPEEEAAIRLRLGSVTMETPQQRVEEHRQALRLSQVSDVTRARHLAWMAYTLFTSAQSYDREPLDEAAQAAAATGDLESMILSETTVAFIEADEGYPTRAIRRLDDLQALTASGEETPAHMVAAIQRVSLFAAVGRIDEAAKDVDALADRDRRLGNTMMLHIWAIFQGLVHISAGRITAARAAVDSVPPEARAGSTELNMVRRFVLLFIAVFTGDRNLLQEMVVEAHDAYANGSPRVRQTAAGILGFGAWYDGDVYEAARWLGDDSCQVSTPYALEMLLLTARVATAAGDAGLRAGVLRSIAVLECEDPPMPVLGAVAAHARGILARDADAMVGAASALRTCSRPLLYAWAAYDAGRELALDGRDAEALQLFNAAFDTFSLCEAIGAARRVSRVLRDHGVERRVVTRRRDTTGWASLTDAELKVVNLIADGASNRRAAEQLNLSPHTVKSHLRNAFTKLGITSRVELEAARNRYFTAG